MTDLEKQLQCLSQLWHCDIEIAIFSYISLPFFTHRYNFKSILQWGLKSSKNYQSRENGQEDFCRAMTDGLMLHISAD